MRAAWSMVREERDPVFWQAVADHPQVRHITQGIAVDMGAVVEQPTVLPLASEHGGFLFFQRDLIGATYEMHTLYTPEGWGREVHDALIAALAEMFGKHHAALIFTFETEHKQSRAPKTFGFERAIRPTPTAIGDMTLSHLTAERWEASPAWRRACH
jgi:hypothetical protein